MTTTLPTVLISGASEELTSRIEQLIRSQAELSLVKSVTPDDALNETFKAKLVWVELESDPEGNVALLESLIKSHPNTFFVVSKEDLEPELVKRAMQVGALDFLDHKGWAAQIRSVVRRIMAKEFGSKPAQGGSMNSVSRQQPSRQSSWGQLNSLKVSPSTSGFRRVEPNRTAAAQPETPAVQPAAPVPPPEEEEVIVEEAVDEAVDETGEIEEFAEQGQEPEQETQAYENGSAEYTYAEGEGEPVEGEQAEGEQADVEYAVEEEAYPEQSYAEEGEGIPEQTEEQPSEDASAGEYAGEEVAYAKETGEEQSEADLESPEGEWQAEEQAEEEPQAPEEDTTSGADEEEGTAAEQAKPAPKGRWDELDSIISKETPKAEEKKPPSKWGDLTSIQTPKAVQKEMSPTQATDKKWADLDAISAPKPSSTPSSLEKELSASAGNKWGDLDGIGPGKSAQKESPAAPPSNKWEDLDSIGSTPKSFNKEETTEAGSGNKWGDLDALGTPKAKTDPAPAEAGNKWGNLDALGAKGGAPKSNTRSFIKPKSPDEGGAAKPKLGGLDAKGSQAGAEPNGVGAKWGNLDKIQTPQTDSESPSSFKNRFGKKTQQFDMPSGADAGDLESLGASAPAEKKWGSDLNAIPTPKASEATAGAWDLDSIPSPKAEGPEAPGLIAGSLPTSQARNEASEKWKSGMSTDLSTGARQMVEMRDKIKGTKIKVKIGWNNVNVLLAVAIIASVGYLSVQFFSFPEPPTQQTAGK